MATGEEGGRPRLEAFVHASAIAPGERIGAGTRVWQYVVILDGASVGRDCNICAHVFIENDVTIGDRVTIKSGVQLWDGLDVSDDVFIGPNVTFTNDRHPRSGNRDFTIERTRLGKGCSIGGGAVILPGLVIGEGAMVGAGAVVTRDVAPGTTVVGNPARPI
ncbi:acyltransferase [Sphingomonas sp. CBMAI 2297]|uniref:acyltransferase n=1 Tax=Sphingomonas sp. CBMAI 2297 TaxID=2991720 RepID=UPI0024551E83|nr:acyltransferase [Sphingomonas sp. CBMAI 2297]